ncbi:MAG: hypothetical protein HC773_25080 [Scytonema sp. CRU_2_7]|nr:hypothetical protein [Scytonema sp. CRU_2_7]
MGTKATVLAIAIGTLPTLVIGAIAYSFANNSINKQFTQGQEAEAIGLLDKVNRYMLGRYGDIQVLSNLPFLTNSQVRQIIDPQEKRAILDRIIKAYKAYDSIAFFDLEGKVIVHLQANMLKTTKISSIFKTRLNKILQLLVSQKNQKVLVL